MKNYLVASQNKINFAQIKSLDRTHGSIKKNKENKNT